MAKLLKSNEVRGSAMPAILADMEKRLKGRVIVDIGYLSDDESTYPCLLLDDGTHIIASRDDEDNGPGVIVHNGMDGSNALCHTSAK
jgi:hypothetical protein